MTGMTRIAALGAFAHQNPDLFDGELHFGKETDDGSRGERRSLVAKLFRDRGAKIEARFAA